MNGPHAAWRGISPLPVRQYAKTTLSIKRQYAEICNCICVRMRHHYTSESRHYTCGSMRKSTTAYAVVYGKSPLHIRQHTDSCNSMCGIVQITNPTLKAKPACFKAHRRLNFNFLQSYDVQ